MKKSFVILSFLCCLEITAFSQDPDHYMVRAGQEASDVIPRGRHFYYAEFQQGQVVYPQGKRSDVMMLNYNTLLQVMQYIDTHGDTLFIPEESNIFKYVRIGKDVFYHHFKEGYFNLFSRNDQFNLATRTRWKIQSRDMMVYNGYGMSSVSPGSTMSERRVGSDSVAPNEDVSYVTESDFYVVGPRDVIFRANRAGIMKAYSENKEQIQDFMREHQTDFENQQSLMELVDYGNSLIKEQQASIAYKPKGN